MKKQTIYKAWVELNELQKTQVISKLSKLSKSEGEAYLKKQGMRYVVDEKGNATGGYQDPYLISGIFSV